MAYVMLNHRAVQHSEALVPVSDRGFRYGDGVFETIGVHGGVPYRFDWHTDRLKRGLSAVHIPMDTKVLQQECAELLHLNQMKDGLLRIQVTRGTSGSGYLPAQGTPTIIIETLPATPASEKPVNLWLSGYRRMPASALPVHAKLCQGLNSTLARMEAAEHNCFEALQLNSQGIVCEASSSNIFWLKGQTLYTPALDCGVLEGSMRNTLLTISPYLVAEVHATPEELVHADAVCITNASWKALAVKTLEPCGFQWESAALAGTLMRALAADIHAHTDQNRRTWQKP